MVAAAHRLAPQSPACPSSPCGPTHVLAERADRLAVGHGVQLQSVPHHLIRIVGSGRLRLMSSALLRHLIHFRSAPAAAPGFWLFTRIFQLSQNHHLLLSATRLVKRHQLGDDLHRGKALRADQLVLGTTRDCSHQPCS